MDDGGFLRYKCRPEQTTPINVDSLNKHRCHNTDEYYYTFTGDVLSIIQTFYLGQVCSNDTHYYQACDRKTEGYKVTNNERLCENWLCHVKTELMLATLTGLKLTGWLCDGKQDCENNIDEAYCENRKVQLRSGSIVDSSYVCNDKCEAFSCEDEANCNGYTYGLYCNNKYIPPTRICDGTYNCDNKDDERSCRVNRKTINKCRRSWAGEIVAVLNYTRCGLIETGHGRYCDRPQMNEYQTNCTDPARIGGKCFIKGYLSTLSKYVICYDELINLKTTICDDNIQNKCSDISPSCRNTHKHKMCDGVNDCDDRSDERHRICRKMTEDTCQRKIGTLGELTLPLDWLGDGVQDCIDGQDEFETWPFCGNDTTLRNVTNNKTCENVFMCPGGKITRFVELDNLCDGIETCGNENEICLLSRGSQNIFTSVLSSETGLVKQLSFCMKGLKSIEILGENICFKKPFIFPNYHYFGVDTKTELILPSKKQDCNHM